jgi:protein-arginine kinase activator protein McsA
LEKLKEDLQKAVENEEYEKAAELRDKIKKIETGS